MSIEANKVCIRRVLHMINNGDVTALGQFFTADYVDHSRPGFSPGPTGVAQFFAMAATAFPDLRATAEEIIAEGDKVVVRGTIHGTHRGDFMGIPATGKQFTVAFVDINRITDGKIAERWANQDDLGMMQQLGLAPMPGQTA